MKYKKKPLIIPKDAIECVKAYSWNRPAPTCLAAKIADARSKIEFVKNLYKPTKTVLLYSGGNDSTLLLDITHGLFDVAAHCNTGTGIPESNEFMRDTISQYKVPLIEEFVREEDSFRTMVLKYGFPGPSKHRMAYVNLKERSLRRVRRRFVERKRCRKDRVLFLAGIRADESVKRMGYDTWLNRDGSTVWLSPIYLFTRDDMDAYRAINAQLPENPVSAKLHISGECLCGAYSRPNEIEEIEFWYPKTASKLRDLETEVRKAGARHCVWGGPRKNLPDEIPSPGPLCAGCAYLKERISGTDPA